MTETTIAISPTLYRRASAYYKKRGTSITSAVENFLQSDTKRVDAKSYTDGDENIPRCLDGTYDLKKMTRKQLAHIVIKADQDISGGRFKTWEDSSARWAKTVGLRCLDTK